MEDGNIIYARILEKSTFNENRLKPASYELRLLGELHYWNLEGTGKLERRILPVCDKTSVIIPKNSITYLWIEEKFLLPEYIAARFNLHIRYVHKGILLGTGPLVDPGFFGRILIPLHNLTNNDYTLKGGDGIIWVEFTKLNMNQFWLEKSEQRPQFLKGNYLGRLSTARPARAIWMATSGLYPWFAMDWR